VDRVEARAAARSVTLSWSTNKSGREGPGRAVEGYRISYAVSASKNRTDWIEPSYLREVPPTSDVVVNHLAPDTPYVVRVEAFNAAGSSSPVFVSFRTQPSETRT
jgi:hypothetical protein